MFLTAMLLWCDLNTQPCINGSKKVEGNYCTCEFQGETRSDTIDICDPNPCYNGGTCSTNGSYVLCSCDSSFTGIHCEYRVRTNYCDSDPCIHGNCTSNSDGLICKCFDGFEGNRCNSSGMCMQGSIEHIRLSAVDDWYWASLGLDFVLFTIFYFNLRLFTGEYCISVTIPNPHLGLTQ